MIRTLILLLALCGAADAAPQTQPQAAATNRPGSVIGYLWTANNAAITGGQVQLRDTVTGRVVQTTVTSSTGEFAFNGVPAGAYVLEYVADTSSSVLAMGHPFTVGLGESVATFVRIGDGRPVTMRLAGSAWELAAGVHAVRRENSSATHVGGSLAVMGRLGRIGWVADIGFTRDGHNRWHGLTGPRLALVDRARVGVFAQGLVGATFWHGTEAFAIQPGLGLDVRTRDRMMLRFQIDAPIERANGRVDTGGRGFIGIVIR